MPRRTKVKYEDFDAFLFDLDGVLWLDRQRIAGTDETLGKLREDGKRIVLLTNRSTFTRVELVKALDAAGVRVAESELMTSAYATALYLSDMCGRCDVHIVGTDGLKSEVRGKCHRIVDDGADYVVVGYKGDLKDEDVEIASKIIRSGARLLACNMDIGMPLPDGTLGPAAADTVKAVEEASGALAQVIGKPKRLIFDLTVREHHLDPRRCLMVGDTLDVDILGGRNAGMKTALVLSGHSKRHHVRGAKVKPDYVFETVNDMF
jgi:HAD superfamily hydrolase (TIGR01450 family)